MSTPLEFAAALLDYMGLPRTQNRLVSLVAFVGIEGGHWHDTARYNPFNTMLGAPGATQAPGLLTGIKSYPDWQTGIAATAHTIAQSNMRTIADALRADASPRDFLTAITRSSWCPGCDYTPFNPQALYNAHANEQDGQIALTSSGGSFWHKPAGKVTLVAVSGVAALTAYFYVMHGRLPTRRDLGV